MTDAIEVSGVLETLDWLEPVAANSPGLVRQARAGGIGPHHRRTRCVRLRELCNLSQVEAARRLGRTRPSCQKVEAATDTNSGPARLITAAAQVYEVSVDFLFGIRTTGRRAFPVGHSLGFWTHGNACVTRPPHVGSCPCRGRHCLKDDRRTVAAVGSMGEALDIYRARNKGFDESPASSLLVVMCRGWKPSPVPRKPASSASASASSESRR